MLKNKKAFSGMWQVIIAAVIAIVILVVLIMLINQGVTPNIEKLLSFGETG